MTGDERIPLYPHVIDDEGEHSEEDGGHRGPARRPPDPAGTQPLHDPAALLPRRPDLLAKAAGATEEAPEPDQSDDSEAARSPYSPRFQFALGALVAVALAAVAVIGVLVVGGGNDNSAITGRATKWSSWRPATSGSAFSTQISQHVAHEYRLPDHTQMVAITGGPLEILGLPVTVALRQSAAQGGDIKLIDGRGVLYRMCGLGPQCAIDKGSPSVQRHLLLRREALELALYSFRYMNVDEAVVFLPPRKGDPPSQALYFRKGDRDLRGLVSKPLAATLVRKTPSVQSVTRSPDAARVNTLTTSKLFTVSFTQGNQDARAFLVLDPLTG